MGSSGPTINGLTVAARSADRGVYGSPRGGSVHGFLEHPNLCARIFTQSVIVILQIFDQGLKVAHSRPQPSGLQDETIVPINSLTQNCLGHTNSDGFLRACEGRWTTHDRLPRRQPIEGLS